MKVTFEQTSIPFTGEKQFILVGASCSRKWVKTWEFEYPNPPHPSPSPTSSPPLFFHLALPKNTWTPVTVVLMIPKFYCTIKGYPIYDSISQGCFNTLRKQTKAQTRAKLFLGGVLKEVTTATAFFYLLLPLLHRPSPPPPKLSTLPFIGKHKHLSYTWWCPVSGLPRKPDNINLPSM